MGVGGALFCVSGDWWGGVWLGGGEWGLVHCLIMSNVLMVEKLHFPLFLQVFK